MMTMMMTMTRPLVAVLLFCLHASALASGRQVHGKTSEKEIGLDLWFKSALKECDEVKIDFDNPIPSWLTGKLIHNGPGQFETSKRKVRHIFDGFGKLDSWKFAPPNSVNYSTKFIRSDYYLESMKNDDLASYLTFAKPDPAFGLFDSIKQVSRGMDNTDVSIHMMDGELVTMSDMWRVYTVHPNLTTIGRLDPPGPVDTKSALSSAHPKKEPGTDNWLSFFTTIGLSPELYAMRIKSLTEREVIARIPVDYAPYMHSFAVTKKYMILFVNPVYMSMGKMMKTREAASALTFDPSLPTKVVVIDLHSGKVITLKTESVFMLHQANAYQVGDDVIVADTTTYPNIDSISSFMLESLLDPVKRHGLYFDKVTVKRYVIDLKQMEVKVQDLPVAKGNEGLVKFDFPVYNPNYYCQPYCYIYGVSYKSDGQDFGNMRIVKKSVCDPAKDLFWHEDNHYPGEPHFVPRPGAKEEDDGILLSVILDGEAEKSYIGVFDATTMKLIARADTPEHLPFPFHGTYFPDL